MPSNLSHVCHGRTLSAAALAFLFCLLGLDAAHAQLSGGTEPSGTMLGTYSRAYCPPGFFVRTNAPIGAQGSNPPWIRKEIPQNVTIIECTRQVPQPTREYENYQPCIPPGVYRSNDEVPSGNQRGRDRCMAMGISGPALPCPPGTTLEIRRGAQDRCFRTVIKMATEWAPISCDSTSPQGGRIPCSQHMR